VTNNCNGYIIISYVPPSGPWYLISRDAPSTTNFLVPGSPGSGSVHAYDFPLSLTNFHLQTLYYGRECECGCGCTRQSFINFVRHGICDLNASLSKSEGEDGQSGQSVHCAADCS